MNKINIMYLYSAVGFGGMVRNLSMTVNNLDKNAFNITVVLLTNEGDRDSDIEVQTPTDIEVIKIYEKQKLDLNAIRKIKNLLDEQGIDILSCNGYKADIYGFLLIKLYKCGAKLVSTKHGWVTPGLKFRLYYALDKLTARWFDKVILVSKGQRKEISWVKIPAHKTVIINNAIDPEKTERAPDRDLARNEFGLDKSDFVVGFAGRLSRQKDIKTILFAVKEALDSQNNIKFLVAGEGLRKRELEKASEDLDITDKVIFAGHQKDVKKTYNALDLYISSSLKEGLPNGVLEAQAAGVPCIATDTSGNNDIIKDQLNGLLFKPRDYKSLSQKIITLLKNRNLAEKFAAEGKEIIKEKFCLQARINKLENLYKGLMFG